MTKIFFLTMIFSFLLKSNNFFILLLSLEIGVLGLIIISSNFTPQKFIILVILFVMSSIMGIILFMISMKKFSNFFVNSWFF